MKMKDDFVTNSSSCSFVVWGISMTVDEIKKQAGPRLFSLMKKAEQATQDAKAVNRGAFMVIATAPDEEKLKAEYAEFMEEDTDPYEIESLLEENGLEAERMPEEDEIMIGISPFDIKPDQTLTQFKSGICHSLELVGIKVEPDSLERIEEAWENR